MTLSLVNPDHYNLTGLYYQAQHNCHADFLGKELFEYEVDGDNECRIPKKLVQINRLDFISFHFMTFEENVD